MAEAFVTRDILDGCVEQTSRRPYIHGCVIHVRNSGRGLTAASGNFRSSSRFFATSATKLFTTAVILKLEAAGRILPGDRIGEFLPRETIDGLHVMDGVERSHLIEVRHLLSNTSGIPDYADRQTLGRDLCREDRAWTMESALPAVRKKQAGFPPGERAAYSDTNFLLLGAVIEVVTGKPVRAVFEEMIIRPLGIEDTYLYEGAPDSRLVPVYYRDQALDVPMFMASLGARGGIVSTASDLGRFIEAFFGGALVDPSVIEQLRRWRPLPGPWPFHYGIGMMRQPLPDLAPEGSLDGHWGQSGAFAFIDPGSGTCLSGSVNQFVGHMAALRAMICILRRQMR